MAGRDFPRDLARAPAIHGAEADQHAPHARRCGFLLRGAAHHALHRRSEIRSCQGRERDRAALLSHHRVRGAARPDRAGRDLDRLHQAVYVIAVLGVIHFLLQTKIEISESIMAAGFLVWLLGYRVLHRFAGEVTVVWQLALTVAATVLTACGEAL